MDYSTPAHLTKQELEELTRAAIWPDQPSREPEPSIINEKTIADFTRVVEQTGISARGRAEVQMKEAAN